MNTIKMFKYSFRYIIKSYGIFIAITAAIIHFFLIFSIASDSNGGIGGMEMSTYIYMIVLGIVVFRENFNMSVQSGISRKTFFAGMTISNVVLALIASINDTILAILGNIYEKHIETFGYDCIYEQAFLNPDINLFDKRILNASDYFNVFIMDFTTDLAVIFIGFFIGAALYRLGKAFKIIIPVAIYAICQITALLDAILFDSVIMTRIYKTFIWIIESNWHMAVFFPVIAVLFAAGTFLFTRRMSIKEKV
ncbi:hypothetical protein [Porcipelethomonas sp.]|uniref:hypothetical protein n=1 Tax=Porcipelethomonas sp. TaxID=2981675 RepID=UPI003EF30734